MIRNKWMLIAVSIPAAVLSMVSSGQSYAVGPGDLGFPLGQAGQMPAGLKVNMYPKVMCLPEPTRQPTPDQSQCALSVDMVLAIEAKSGARFLNVVPPPPAPNSTAPVSFTLGWFKGNSKYMDVGNCLVESESRISCKITYNGIEKMAKGDALQTQGAVVGLSAQNTCTPSFQLWWYATNGEPQRGQQFPPSTPSNPPYNSNNDLWGENDFYTIKTNGPCTSSA